VDVVTTIRKKPTSATLRCSVTPANACWAKL
jgi:hypothetical protein